MVLRGDHEPELLVDPLVLPVVPEHLLLALQGRHLDLVKADEALQQQTAERERAERAFAQERNLLRSLMGNIPDHIYFKDRQFRFVRCSRSQAKLFHLDNPDELIGKSDFDFFTREHAQQASDDEQRIMRTREPIIGLLEKETWADGHETWVSTTKMPLCDQAGEVIGTFGISRDFTALKQTETELDYERDLFRMVLETMPGRIYCKDAQSRLVRCSNTMATELRLKAPSEAVGKSDFDFMAEACARQNYEEEQHIIRTGEPVIGVVKKEIWQDDRETWVLATKIPWRDKTGRIIGTFGIAKDITQLKEAEKLESTHKQLMLASRQGGMAEVATNVLHNIGNVLNSVNVTATLLTDKLKHLKISHLAQLADILSEHAHEPHFLSTDEKGKHVPGYLKDLSEHLVHEQETLLNELSQLRQNIEHISEVVAMQQPYAKLAGVTEKVKASELVEDSLRLNSAALIRHDVQLLKDYQDDPDLVVEKHKVLQILVNLIRNATYACDESGRTTKQITMRIARPEPDKVQIQVIDNGVGIPAENMTRIFNHGFSTRKGGHGFGLHYSANAATELGGRLVVESAGPGQGATFTLELAAFNYYGNSFLTPAARGK